MLGSPKTSLISLNSLFPKHHLTLLDTRSPRTNPYKNQLPDVLIRGQQTYRQKRGYPTLQACKGFGSTNRKRFSTRNTSKGHLPKDEAGIVSEYLGGVNVVVLGDSTELNVATASLLAPMFGYTPLHTKHIIQQLEKKTLEEFVSQDGESELGLSEAVVMESLSNHVRCVISMCGDGIGAAARGACWQYIFGSVSVWLDMDDDDDSEKPQHEAYHQCDVHLKIKAVTEEHLSGGQSRTTQSVEDLARSILPDLLKALRDTLGTEKDLCKRKNLYVRLGCRGDWPNIELPDWAPKE